jgi:hypothetical protein
MLRLRWWIAAILAMLPIGLLGDDKPSSSGQEVVLTVTNRSETPVMFSAAQIERLPHVELKAGKDHVYRGVPLAEFLRVAGVIWEGKCSPLLTCYLLVEGGDGYRVLFSIPEIDPGQCHEMVLLADRCDGKPLSKADGPYQTVEQDAKQHGRWVRHATKITLVQALPRSRPKAK